MGLDFRAPAVPGRVYVWRAFIEKRESERKVWVRGEMRCLREFGVGEMSARNVVDIDVDVAGGDGNGVSVEEREGVLVAEARALFVEPRRVEVCISFVYFYTPYCFGFGRDANWFFSRGWCRCIRTEVTSDGSFLIDIDSIILDIEIR